MPRITALNPAETTGQTKKLLDGVQAKLGMTPNLMRTLANAPAALEAYLHFGAALGSGVLDAKFREQIAIAVAQANSCEYCLSAHSAIGKMVGLSAVEMMHAPARMTNVCFRHTEVSGTIACKRGI